VSDETLPGAEELAARARTILEAHWQPEGYTVPNAGVYPHQWLWDSCFHAIIWAHLGEGERALAELRNVFAHQAADGFVPHMTYWRQPDLHADFWGRRWTSCITQPPMYGHAIAELVRLGIDVEQELIDRADAGLRFFVEKRTATRGRFTGTFVVHPWETGCDDSPTWDDELFPDGRWDPTLAHQLKGDLVRAIRFDPATGSPIGSTRFEAFSASFDELVTFNHAELRSFEPRPAAPRQPLLLRLFPRPAAPMRALHPALEESLGLLNGVVRRTTVDDAWAQIVDPAVFGGECGPAQVRRDSPGFDPRMYWRGPAWPQLTYLFWVAAKRHDNLAAERYLREAAIRGAVRSGFAEYWHPDTGEGFGAVPQSWTGLVAVMAAGAPEEERSD
jgi:hypothetical protein